MFDQSMSFITNKTHKNTVDLVHSVLIIGVCIKVNYCKI